MTKILVIEDESGIRESIQEILELENFTVNVAKDGGIGLKMAQEQSPDLIICDIMMPKLDGHGVLMALHQNEATESIPFIFLTARADKTAQRQGMELGADDYLTKPFTPSELLNAVETRLRKHALLTRNYNEMKQLADTERQKSKKLTKEVQANQQMIEIKDEILKKLAQDLRDPLSNINMAILMLQNAATETDRDRYLNILQEECSREISLLNEISSLQELVSPNNASLLRRFNLLKG